MIKSHISPSAGTGGNLWMLVERQCAIMLLYIGRKRLFEMASWVAYRRVACFLPWFIRPFHGKHHLDRRSLDLSAMTVPSSQSGKGLSNSSANWPMRFSLLCRALEHTPEITLGWRMETEFTAFDIPRQLRRRKEKRYQLLLEGYDERGRTGYRTTKTTTNGAIIASWCGAETWITISASNRLRVKSCPFYRTWWAYLLYIAFFWRWAFSEL